MLFPDKGAQCKCFGSPWGSRAIAQTPQTGGLHLLGLRQTHPVHDPGDTYVKDRAAWVENSTPRQKI